ncbi:MAG: hypothetical protein HGA44_01250 [Cellulomonadaceae bacterium]|nr:hypothetical protein [Cellulomonadaceae bacterium]
MIIAVAIAFLCTLGTALAGLAMHHSVVRYRDVRHVLALRATTHGSSTNDPLAIFSAAEIEALSSAPPRALVRGTRWIRGGRCPDPWAEDFCVQQHLWAVYANRLREMALAGIVVAELIAVVGAGLIGVALTDIVGLPSGERGNADLPPVLLALSLLAVFLAATWRLTILREWQGAADRYRELAVADVQERRRR